MATNDIARVYATSLVEVGQQNNNLPELGAELKSISDLLRDDDIGQFLKSPKFSKDAKQGIVKKAFSGNISEYMLNFLHVIIENDRINAINDISQTVDDLVDITNNVLRVTITTNIKLEESALSKIKDELSAKFEKEIVVTEKIDESILGGIIIKAGDLVMDGSLLKDLKNIKANLLNSTVRSEVVYED